MLNAQILMPYRFFLFVAVLCAGAGVLHAQPVLTLEEALAQALESNFAVRTAQNDARVAANNYALGNAGFLPTLSANAGTSGSLADTRQTFITGEPQERDGATTTRYNAGVQLGWTVFDGLRRFAAYDRLGVLAAFEQNQAGATREDVAALTIIDYYSLVAIQEQVRVQTEAVALSEERLRIAEVRRDLGSASDLEVRQALVDLNTDRAALLRAQADLANAKVVFNRRLGRPGNPAFTVADTIEVDPTLQLETLAPATFAQNVELELATANRQIAAQAVSEESAAWWPRLGLTAGYGYSFLEAEAGFLASNESTDWTYGLSLSYPLFDGFNRQRRVQNAQIQLRTAELNVEEVQLQLETDLTTTYTEYALALEQITLERENLTVARLVAVGFAAKRAETTLGQLSGRLARYR